MNRETFEKLAQSALSEVLDELWFPRKAGVGYAVDLRFHPVRQCGMKQSSARISPMVERACFRSAFAKT